MARWTPTLFPVLILLAACSSGGTTTPDGDAVASVSVSPATPAVTTGSTVQLTATPKDASGAALTGRTVTWSSSATGTATVSGSGLVTGVAAGTATITATAEGRSGQATVTVTAGTVAVATVTLSAAAGPLMPGQVATLTATTRDGNGNTLAGRTVTWQSSAEGVATVSASGIVTAVAPGTTTITATSEGKSGATQVTVIPHPVATVTLTGGATSLLVGATTTFTATMRDAEARELTGRTVTWSTSNASVATVSTTGVVTGVAAGGPVTITAASEGKSATAQVSVTAPPPTVTDGLISVGLVHACGISNGITRCWGGGNAGQLGHGLSPSSQATPVVVSGNHTFKMVVAGNANSCALETNGSAWCWGLGTRGTLGNGAGTSSTVPVAVSGGHVFTRIATTSGGVGTMCALEANGSAWCWGAGLSGEIGDGAGSDRLVPTAVSGGLVFTDIAGNNTSFCGTTVSGAVWCWGGNAFGTFGNGTLTTSKVPVAAATGLQYASLGRGVNALCGRKSDNTIWCSGIATGGNMGTGSATDAINTTPIVAAGGLPFTSVGLGAVFGCGRAPSGAGYCWGSAGLLGDGSSAGRPAPGLVSGGLVFTEISAGYESACGRTVAGEFWCWGTGGLGQAGDGTTENKLAPARVIPW